MEDHPRILPLTSSRTSRPDFEAEPPTTPHFDNPHLSELPDKTQSTDCIPKPELPDKAPGLFDFSLGLLTGAALALLLNLPSKTK